MARKRFSDEDVIRLLRQIEVETASGVSIANPQMPFTDHKGLIAQLFKIFRHDFEIERHPSI